MFRTDPGKFKRKAAQAIQASRASHERYGHKRRPHPATSLAVYSDNQTAILAAVEDWKARHGQQRLGTEDLSWIALSLGYRGPGGARVTINPAAYDRAVAQWREVTGRRFPSWVDVFGIIESMGFQRPGVASAEGQASTSRRTAS
jgi:hypothetical protein